MKKNSNSRYKNIKERLDDLISNHFGYLLFSLILLIISIFSTGFVYAISGSTVTAFVVFLFLYFFTGLALSLAILEAFQPNSSRYFLKMALFGYPNVFMSLFTDKLTNFILK